MKKRSRYEEEFLVDGLISHVVEPVGCDVLDFILPIVEFRHDFYAQHGHCPNDVELAAELNDGEKTKLEESAADVLRNLESFFSTKPPGDIAPSVHSALGLRWGYHDADIRKVRIASKESGIPPEELVIAEISLIERLGWTVKDSLTERKKWLRS